MTRVVTVTPLQVFCARWLVEHRGDTRPAVVAIANATPAVSDLYIGKHRKAS